MINTKLKLIQKHFILVGVGTAGQQRTLTKQTNTCKENKKLLLKNSKWWQTDSLSNVNLIKLTDERNEGPTWLVLS